MQAAECVFCKIASKGIATGESACTEDLEFDILMQSRGVTIPADRNAGMSED
jgi:hypothetical protein